jgi:Metallo-peptidase family M12/Divergent InlB B-repeat domain/FG-GAP-like repeat
MKKIPRYFARLITTTCLLIAVGGCGSSTDPDATASTESQPTSSWSTLSQWAKELVHIPPSKAQLEEGFLIATNETAALPQAGASAPATGFTVKVDMLMAMQPGQSVALTLPGAPTYEVELDRIETISLNNGKVWLGHLKGLGKSYFVNISVLDGSLVGEMETPEGAYSLSGQQRNAVLLKIDKVERFQKKMQRSTDVLVPDKPIGVKPPRLTLDGSDAPDGLVLPRLAVPPKADGPAVINMLALTTPGYATTVGANAQTCMNMAVASANQAFANSQIQLSLNLVHVGSVTEVPDTAIGDVALRAMTPWDASAIPALAERVADLRVQYAADVVVLFRPTAAGDSAGGIAWLGGYRSSETSPLVDMTTQGRNAYAVVHAYSYNDCSYLANTLAHELGHNFGSNHTRVMTGSDPTRGALNSSFGHSGTGTSGQAFTTIMGYGPLVRLFSNPNLSTDCYGTTCGVASGANSADNAYGFQQIRHQIAGWRNFNKKLKINLATTGSTAGDVSFPRSDGYWGSCSQGELCLEYYPSGASATLSAYNANGAVFTGWSGACTGTSTNCVITMDAVKNVTANFAQGVPLTVNYLGDPGGLIYSSGSVGCGTWGDGSVATTCNASYIPNSQVTLTAYNNGLSFIGWGGACAGVLTSSCVVTMDSAKTVSAQFSSTGKTLSVSKTGAGTGTVSGGTINCGSICAANIVAGGTVTLSASASPGSTFTGWSGACTGVAACTVTMDVSKSVTANFALSQFSLSVTKAGAGMGTVSGGGINCGATCNVNSNYGSSVTLTATPAVGSAFAGWSGGCTGTGACTLTIDAAKSVTATFTLNQYTLTVAKAGTGTGTVSGGGINCGATCSVNSNYGTSVTLTATPAAGSTFSSWSGGCTGSGACTLTIDAAKSVTATFTLNQYNLGVAKTGTGVGTISGGGINCGTTCNVSSSYGSSITLAAAPATGSTFAGWSGACTGTGTCSLTMTAAKTVTAAFTLNQYTLSVSKTGSGTVSGSGVNCGATCSASLNHGTTASLSATPAEGYTFTGWGGACTGTGSCTFSMNSAKAVTATFTTSAPSTQTLTVSKTGPGGVTASGINCGTTCSASFSTGATATLTANPGSGAKLKEWGGACSGTQLVCTLTMDTAKAVSATFTFLTRTDLQVKGVADFDGDGKADILWVRPDGQIFISLMNSNNVLAWNNVGSSTLTVMGVGDFNGDGNADIVWRNMSTGAVSIDLVQAGYITGSLTVGQTPIALNTKLEGIGDFDGNGRADMLWRNQTTGRAVMSYHNADGSVASWPEVSPFINPVTTTALKVGDINGDGKADIVWRNMSTGNVVISLMNGNVPTWKTITASPISPTVALEAIGDFDGNGRADLLWRNTLTGRSLMSYHNADATVASWPVVSKYIDPSSTSAQGAGDFDGDGKADILWRNLATGSAVISLMNGNLPNWLKVDL